MAGSQGQTISARGQTCFPEGNKRTEVLSDHHHLDDIAAADICSATTPLLGRPS